MPPDSARQALNASASSLGLNLDANQVNALLAYRDLLVRWNRVYNLTAIRDPAQMLHQHLVDSLAVVEPIRRFLSTRSTPQASALDVGSGAGLPGVVLAIGLPEVRMTCIDAIGKKVSFVKQAAAELGLTNLVARHIRAEQLSDDKFDLITSRAFAALAEFTRLTRHCLVPGGIWAAMKGKSPQTELTQLAPDIDVFHVEQLLVPGLRAERCLVWMRPRPA